MQDNKAKLHVLSSMMRNPKISRMISDAWDAPVGSTKRKQVKSILDTVNKVSGKRFNDGKGGPGTSFKKTDYLPYNQSTPNSYDRLVVMPSAPFRQGGGNDGKGGPANQSMMSYSSPLQSRETPAPMTWGSQAPATPTKPGLPSKYQTLANQTMGTPTWTPGSYDIEGKGFERQLISGPSQTKYFYPKSVVKKPGTNELYGVPQPTDYVDYKPLTPSEYEEKGVQGKVLHYIGGKLVPSVLNTGMKAGLGIGSGIEWGTENLAKAINNALSGWVGHGTLTPVPWTTLANTEGGKRLDVMERTTSLPKGQPGGVTPTTTPIVTPAQATALTWPGSTPATPSTGPAKTYGPAVPADYSNITNAVAGQTEQLSPEQEDSNLYYTELINTGKFTPEEASQEVQNTYNLAPTNTPTGTGTVNISGTMPGTASTTGTPVGPGGTEELAQIAAGEISPGNYADKIRSMGLSDLRRLFPGVPDDQLPHGASLSGQIADLQKTIKKETNLDDWLNQRQQLIDSGKTITTDLTDYITGRDTYIKDIDTMIDNAKNTMLNSGMSDPKDMRASADYINYLSILKGRQNKRYTDFLNTSINQHNAKLTEIDDMYTKAKDLYTSELATRSAITQEEYNRWNARLTETWNAIHQQNDPAANDAHLKALAEINKINTDTAIAAQKGLKDVGSVDYWADQKEYKDQFVDEKTGVIRPDINITNQIIAAVNQNHDIDGAINLVESGISKALSGDVDFDQAYSTLNSMRNNLYGIQQGINPSVATKTYGTGGPAIALNLAGGMYSKASEIIKKYVKDNKSKFIPAIKDLTPGGMLEMNWAKPKTKDEWVNKYAAQGLNKDMLSDIYDGYTSAVKSAYPNEPEKGRAIFTSFDQSGEKPIMDINDKNIDDAADSIARGIINNNMALFQNPQLQQQ